MRTLVLPLLHRMLTSDQIDLILNFGTTMREPAPWICQSPAVTKMLAKLNIETEVPLMGWVASEAWLSQNQTVFEAFATQSWRAKQRFITESKLWESIRPLTKAENDEVFHALRQAYPATILTDFHATSSCI